SALPVNGVFSILWDSIARGVHYVPLEAEHAIQHHSYLLAAGTGVRLRHLRCQSQWVLAIG
ncbi:hypothetical protein, partial [Bacteroides fragilis]|uniref:hypothetical protein n=1 Tax=Bacteroides fragilis TaxID=817 RepID=UPI0032EB6E02